jgi:hypothetical protein
MLKSKHGFVAGVVFLLLAAIIPVSLAGAAIFHEPDPYYYGEGSVGAKIPAVTGTFIQPPLCEGWTDQQWDSHLDMLLSAGINIVIVQWTAETPNGEFSFAGFPVPAGWKTSSSGFKSDPAMLEGLLKSAEKKNVKVFMGLNTADEWWSNSFTQADWRKKQSDVGNALAKVLYNSYKAKYPHAFTGWYWVWEMYGNAFGYGKDWSEMLNSNLDYLSTLDNSMPLLLSPFMSSYIRLAPKQEEVMWTGFFSSTHLRSGDIFCPQDSVGAAAFTMKYADEHLAAMKKAADSKPGLVFWVNNETFTKDFKPATLDRFISQLYISGKYTDTHVSFAYSHYYNPAIINPSFDRAYKSFEASGEVDKTPPALPKLAAMASQDKSTVTLTVTPADPADCCIITLFRGNQVLDVHEVLEVTTDSFVYQKVDKIKIGSNGIEYFATVTDCWGNVSEKAQLVVH